MPPSPSKNTSNSRIAVAEFGQFVLASQDQITRRWVTVVDRSPEIAAAENLTYQQVLDHLPQLCTELGLLLKHPEAPAIRLEAKRDAARHGLKRWQQGYKLEELIREICLIRDEFIGNWFNVFARDRASFDNAARDLARDIVQRFFDNLIIDSTLQFADEQSEAISNVQVELTKANAAAGNAKSELLSHVSHILREPLCAISFAAEALNCDEELSDGAKENVCIILRNVRVEAEHVNELLVASQLQSSAQDKARDAELSGE